MATHEVGPIVSNVVQPLVDQTLIPFDASVAFAFSLTLGASHKLDNPSGLVAGSLYLLAVTQGGAGSLVLAYAELFRFPSPGVVPTLSTEVGATDLLLFYSDGTYLNYLSVTHYLVVPEVAPSGLTASSNQAGQVTLAWTDNSSDEDGFYVYADYTGTGNTYGVVHTTAAGVTSYVDPGLDPGAYLYKLQAFKGTTISAFSNEVTGTAV